MKIFLQPREILVVLLPGSAVTTRGFAAGNAHEVTALNWRNFHFCRRTGCRESYGERNQRQPAQNGSDHVLEASGSRDGKPFQKLQRDEADRFPARECSSLKSIEQLFLALYPETNRHAKSR